MKSECDHEWVSARNKIITSGEICAKCFAIREGERGDVGQSAVAMSKAWPGMYRGMSAATEQTVAERLFKHFFDMSLAEDLITDVLMLDGNGWNDLWWDYYDNSLEIGLCEPGYALSAAALSKIWELGFSRMWINYKDGTNTYYTPGSEPHNYPHPCGNESNYKDRRQIAKRDARIAELESPPPAIEVSPKLGEATEQTEALLHDCRNALDCCGERDNSHFCTKCDSNVDRNAPLRHRLDALLAAPIAPAVEQKSYWLLERGQLERQEPTLWLTGDDWQRSKPYFGAWTETAAKAKRFSDRESAEEYLRGVNIGCCHATEHIDLVSAGEQEHEK